MTLTLWHPYIKKKKCTQHVILPFFVLAKCSKKCAKTSCPSLSVVGSRDLFFSRGKLQRDNTENSIQIFPEKELRGLSPISTFMCLWAIYIFPGSVCLFCCRKICGPILGIYKCSKTHKCGKWDWGHAVPFLGIQKWNFRCSVVHNRPALSMSNVRCPAHPTEVFTAGGPCANVRMGQ